MSRSSGLSGPALLPAENLMEGILAPHLTDVGAELGGVGRRQAAVGQNGQLPICELLPIAVDGVTEHVPAPGRGEGLLRLGRRTPELSRRVQM